MEFFAVNVAGISLISCLEWRTLTGLTTPVKEIVEHASDIGASLYVETRNETDITCGFLPNERRVDLPKRAHSLAAVFAGVPDLSPDCVLVVQDKDVALMAALRNGMPAPGFDGYGPIAEIEELAKKFIQLAPGNVTVYGNCEQLSPVALTLDDVVKKSKTLKTSRLQAVPRPWVKVACLIATLLLLGGGAKYGYDYKQEQKRKAAERLAYVNVDEEYARSIRELFKAGLPVRQSVLQIRDVLASTPVTIGGWNLAEVVCQKDGCSYVWKNEFGTNRTFVPPAGALNLKYSNKGDQILYQIGFKTPLSTGIPYEKSLTNDQILRDVTGDLQEFRDFNVTQSFEPPAGDYGLPPGLPSTPTKTYKEGAFTLSGPWYALDAAQKLPEAAALETLKINFGAEEGIGFTITGKYYVQ